MGLRQTEYPLRAQRATSPLPRGSAGDRSRLLKREMEGLVVEARRLGLQLDDVLAAIAGHWEKLK